MTLPVNQPEEWCKDGLRFGCVGCGNCCTGGPGYVWITEEETKRIAEHLQLTPAQVLRQYGRKVSGHIGLKEKRPNSRGEYDCVFLEEIPVENDTQKIRRICTIYPVRPLQCRTWPFWNSNLASPHAWAGAGKRCPGVGKGRVWTREEMLARQNATQWPEER